MYNIPFTLLPFIIYGHIKTLIARFSPSYHRHRWTAGPQRGGQAVLSDDRILAAVHQLNDLLALAAGVRLVQVEGGLAVVKTVGHGSENKALQMKDGKALVNGK